jgi:uncharacterized membrane protein required for colicin V production
MNANGQLPFNWFDIAVLLLLLVGYKRGQSHGLSQEILAVIKWVTIIGVSAFTYEPLGTWLSPTLGISKLLAYVLAYSTIALVITLIFAILNSTVGEKLKGTDKFGKAEFHLGKPAGMLRFLCIILALMALLNARFYSTAEVRAMAKYQNDNYGSSFFPTLSSIQDGVFRESFLGKQAKQHISFLFIKPTPAIGGSTLGSGAMPTSGRQREFNVP